MKKLNILVTAILLSFIFSVTTSAATFTRQLQIGMSGADVSELQSFLAQDPYIYPQGLITGYFGSLTKAAVSRFQSMNGISPVGRVGPITLSMLNTKISSDTDNAPIISNINVNTYTGGQSIIHWDTNEMTTGVVYYNSSPLNLTESYNDVFVNGGYVTMSDANFKTSRDVTLSNLMSNTTYYYMIYTKDANGNVSVSWPTTFRTP